jgi:PIN domain nuclease of toxin-antitoxin system
MRVLLDTHTFLWWILDDARLSSQARAILKDGRNTLLVSAATGWEIAIKARLGKLTLPSEPLPFVAEQLSRNNLSPLAIDLAHTLHVYSLPDIHRDPFDRILVVQSLLGQLPILTVDPVMAKYGVEVIW